MLDPAHRIFLIRLDISINDYLDGSDFWGNIKFLPLSFEVKGVGVNDKDIQIYSLAPEYSSYVVQESLVSSQVDSLTAAAAGLTGNTALQGSGVFQRALEEGMLTLKEQPLQFASYSDQSNKFAFSFGPRRHIEKRSWINPLRIFGHKYDITYSIDPGPRAVYALVIAPCAVKDLGVEAYPGSGSVSTGLSKNITELHEKKSNKKFSFSMEAVGSDCGPPQLVGDLEVQPNELYPKVINTLLITSKFPVSSDSQVWINHYNVPQDQIAVLGRYQLKVTITPNDSVKALIKRSQPAKLALTTPGITGSSKQNTILMAANKLDILDSDATEPKYTLDPLSGAAGTDVKITADNSPLDLTKVNAVTVGGVAAPVVSTPTKQNLFVRIPIPVTDKVDHPVSIDVSFTDGSKNLFLLNKFTYVAPKENSK